VSADSAVLLQMLLLPKWQKTRQVISSAKSYVPLALAYTALLIASWQPDTLSLILPGSFSEGLSGDSVCDAWCLGHVLRVWAGIV
jgi:hypothetical protein